MIRIRVENMTCDGCARGVAATLREAAPDAAVEVSLEQREARVEAPDAAPLLAALRDDGWEAKEVP